MRHDTTCDEQGNILRRDIYDFDAGTITIQIPDRADEVVPIPIDAIEQEQSNQRQSRIEQARTDLPNKPAMPRAAAGIADRVAELELIVADLLEDR